jgi:hypothetical protein
LNAEIIGFGSAKGMRENLNLGKIKWGFHCRMFLIDIQHSSLGKTFNGTTGNTFHDKKCTPISQNRQ